VALHRQRVRLRPVGRVTKPSRGIAQAFALAYWTAATVWVAATETPGLTGFPVGEGQAKVQAACGPCHAVTIVTSARKSEADWESTINAMITRGARVPDEDYDLILRYLARHFPVSE
jgi:mono/diheme cytochrome c family protein